MPSARLSFTAALLFGLLATAAGAGQISSGAKGGLAETSVCPALSAQLKIAQFDYPCVASQGARETIARVLTEPRQLGFAGLDAFVQESRQLKAEGALLIVRQDDARECLFAVTRNAEISNFGELTAHAPELRFVLPPPSSDRASSFELLRSTGTDGLSGAKSVTHADALTSAVRESLSAADTVGVFVEFADPARQTLALVKELGGHVVGVIDRAILRQQIGGKKIYYAQETQVDNAAWITPARKIVTACTPLVVFTGHPDRVADAKARRDHEDLIRTVSALDKAALLPQHSLMQRLLDRTKELSAEASETVLRAGEQAREKAGPYTQKVLQSAKQATDQAIAATGRASEAAKPYVDKGKEAAEKAYDDAARIAKELIDKSNSNATPKND